MYWMGENELSQGFRNLLSDRQTERERPTKLYTTPLLGLMIIILVRTFFYSWIKMRLVQVLYMYIRYIILTYSRYGILSARGGGAMPNYPRLKTPLPVTAVGRRQSECQIQRAVVQLSTAGKHVNRYAADHRHVIKRASQHHHYYVSFLGMLLSGCNFDLTTRRHVCGPILRPRYKRLLQPTITGSHVLRLVVLLNIIGFWPILYTYYYCRSGPWPMGG